MDISVYFKIWIGFYYIKEYIRAFTSITIKFQVVVRGDFSRFLLFLSLMQEAFDQILAPGMLSPPAPPHTQHPGYKLLMARTVSIIF